MNTSADAADQVVRMTLNGVEMAFKITGDNAPKAARLIFHAFTAVKNESKRSKGAIRLVNLARSGKKLDVTAVMDKDLKKFCIEAKKYGILYTILKDRNKSDGLTEIMYKSEDKEKLGRVFEKLNMATYDTAEVEHEIAPDLQSQPPPDRTGHEISDPDQFIEEIMKKKESEPPKEAVHAQNPPQARTTKYARSGQDSASRGGTRQRANSENEPEASGRRSVRKELAEIREGMEKGTAEKTPKSRTKQPLTAEHKDPGKKKKHKNKSKER